MNPHTLLRKMAVKVASAVRAMPCSYRQTYSDFRALEHALFSDNLDGARDAFARIQSDSPKIAEALSSSPFPTDNHRLCALHELNQCLLIGDLTGAKVASTKFQS